MKIAVFHNLPSGGALRALKEKIRLFKKLGCSVEVFTFSTAETELFQLREVCDKIHTEPLFFRGISAFYNYKKASQNCAEAMRSSGADIFWVEKCRFLGSPEVLRYLKNPIFYMQEPTRIKAHEKLAPGNRGKTSDGDSRNFQNIFSKKIFKFPLYFWREQNDKKNARNYGKLFANSRFSAEWIENVYGIKPEVLYQGVDTEFFKPSVEINPKEYILSVGRLDGSKGHDFSIRVIGKISEKLRPELILLADDADPQTLQSLEKQAKQNNVRLKILLSVSEDELRQHYRNSIAVLCSAHNEPFGLVPLEAMACGVPVLAVDEGGYQETVIHEKTGYLLTRDAELWAKQLELILSDSVLRTRLGGNGRSETTARWDWDLMLSAYEKSLYNKPLS